MSNSLGPHGLYPTRLLRPWNFPGKSIGVGCQFLLQCMKVKVKSLSRAGLLATPWTAAYQAPPSMGFSRQEYWSGVPLPSPSSYGLQYFPHQNSYTRIQFPHPQSPSLYTPSFHTDTFTLRYPNDLSGACHFSRVRPFHVLCKNILKILVGL